MLRQISNGLNQPMSVNVSEDRYGRNELDDMKRGLEYLYEFKEKLAKLHPNVMDAIENMLQRPRY
jgi:hypothetical protein